MRRCARHLRAALLARIYEILPLRCPCCAGPLRIIAFLTEPASVNALLSHLGEPSAAPEVAPARGPPLGEQAAQSHRDDTPAPAPEYVFDQLLSW
jgi:hypothetical protein